MRRLELAAVTVLILVSCATAANAGQAATKVEKAGEFGVGAGVSSVSWFPGAPARVAGPNLDVRVGGRVRKGLTMGAAVGWYGLADEEPRADDFTPHPNGVNLIVNRTPKVAQMKTYGLYAQLKLTPSIFVRAAGGIGRQSYAVYLGRPVVAGERAENGFMWSIAAGKTWRPAHQLGFAVEAFFVHSTGWFETSARQVAGVQFVPLLRWR